MLTSLLSSVTYPPNLAPNGAVSPHFGLHYRGWRPPRLLTVTPNVPYGNHRIVPLENLPQAWPECAIPSDR